MEQISIQSKDDVVMKILYYFVTQENYHPVLIHGVNNEIWLENMDNNIKLIRINTNYLHNNVQYKEDIRKVNIIMKTIKRKTLSFNMNILNILANASEDVNVSEDKHISSIKVSKINDLKNNKIISEIFPGVKEKISSKKSDALDFFKMTHNLNAKNKEEEKRFEKIFKNNKPTITYGIIAINVILFVLMLNTNIFNYLVNNFALHGMLVQQGQVYRLFTHMFLHGGIMHIFFNMYALFVIGPNIERYYGKWKFLIIYLLSGIMGGVFSCVFNNSFSLGASGAIFGLFGSMLYFSYNFRATIDSIVRSPVLPVIVLNLLLGFMIPNVDVFGHIGGLLGGFLISMAVGIDNKTKKQDKINGFIVFGLLIIFMIFMLSRK